ncbi:hypothetical protein [Paraburkholderia flagellata]|uniref:hypothetical protein n=1 Tax=Paraburkholderia flagellata TaxID=2883241 RepID=UPI001F238CE5|nr:hypothetical protein [Paraburkholderia flagellata]
MSKRMAMVIVVAGVSGCAGISAIPLTKDGAPTGQQEGFRYYVPKPYLLVVEMPAATTDGTDTAQNPIQPAPANPASPGGAPPAAAGGGAPPVIGAINPQPAQPVQPAQHAKHGGQPPARTHAAGAAAPASDTTGKGGAPSGTSDANTASTGDTSFYVASSNSNYVIKLIYLPDYSHPMAVSVHSGLIGTSSIQLGFQNGWMLTSLNGSSDNKVAETLASVASIIGSIKGVGGGGGTTGGGGGHAAGGAYAPPQILLPGLYAFDDSSNSFLGLCVAQPFGPMTDGQHYGQIPQCTGTQVSNVSGSGGAPK